MPDIRGFTKMLIDGALLPVRANPDVVSDRFKSK